MISMLPCLDENNKLKYYEGKVNFKTNKCNKCEYLSSYGYFIYKIYQEYTLVKCCDIDSKFEKQTSPQPEALLVNKNNSNEKMVIEVKSLPIIYGNNKNEDDKQREKMNRFVNVYLNKIGIEVYGKVKDVLDKLNLLEVFLEIENLLFNKLILFIEVDKRSDFHSRLGKVPEEFLSFPKTKETELRTQIVNNCADFIVNNFINILNNKSILVKTEFDIVDIHFTFGYGRKESTFTIEYFENNTSRNIYFPPAQMASKMEHYYSECEKKFKQYMASEIKRILLLTNDNNYGEEAIINEIKKVKKPEFVDEVWIAFNRYEEVWDENREDFYDGDLIDCEYIKVY